MKKLILVLALISLMLLGDATKIDMGKYILDTGDYKAYDANILNITFDGNYSYLVDFGKDEGYTIVALGEGPLNISSLIEPKPVKKPYSGYISEDPLNSTVLYRGEVKDGLVLGIKFYSMEAAIRILPQISVIPREEYHSDKSGELLEALT